MIGVWSVANAATYVKRFLLANKADGVTYRFPDVSGAMAEVDSTLRTAAAAGDEDADLACRCLADIWYNISVAWERNQRSMEMMDSKIPISTEDRMALRIAERLLDASAAEYPGEKRPYPGAHRRRSRLAQNRHAAKGTQGVCCPSRP